VLDCRQREFPGLQQKFFNSAYYGPSPLRSRQAAQRAIDIEMNPVDFPFAKWRDIPDRVRGALARLLDVSGENISHHASVTEVISYLSLGYPFQSGDKVVLLEGDFPSNILPWMLNQERQGYEVCRLRQECFADPDLLKRKLPVRTKILNLSHVMFNTGRCFDLEAIGSVCRERGVLFVIDVSQSLGGVQLTQEQVNHCDVIVGATYKWLLGPYGHAFAYWTDESLRAVSNVHLSWQTVQSGVDSRNLLNYTIEPLPGARKFDRGQAPNIIVMGMLEKSLELLNEIGLDSIENHNRALVSHFLDHLPKTQFEVITPIGSHRNIVCLRQRDLSSSSNPLEDVLRANGVDASVREGGVRLSFHLFNQISEVDELLEILHKAQ
jgi:cysteine desulfurase/selenocysteine lyase